MEKIDLKLTIQIVFLPFEYSRKILNLKCHTPFAVYFSNDILSVIFSCTFVMFKRVFFKNIYKK